MSEGQIQEDLLGAHPAEEMATAARNDDTSVSTREGTPAEEAINTGAADGEVPGSVATAEGEKEKVRSTADTAGVEHANHDAAATTSTFTLSPTQHLESYLLSVDVSTSKDSMTCYHKTEYLDIDSDALLASVKSLPPTYSVVKAISDLHPSKHNIIQELTRSRSGRVVAVNCGDATDLETPMGTLKVTPISFIIKVDAEREKEQRKEQKKEQWDATKPAFNFATRSTSQQPAALFATAAPTSDSSSEDSDLLQATALHRGQREKAAAEDLTKQLANAEHTSYFAEKDGFLAGIQTYQSITFLPHYQRESFEEIRVKDYAAGIKDPTGLLSTLPGAIYRQGGLLDPSRVAKDCEVPFPFGGSRVLSPAFKKGNGFESLFGTNPAPSVDPFAAAIVSEEFRAARQRLNDGGSLVAAKLAPSTGLFAQPPAASGGFGSTGQGAFRNGGPFGQAATASAGFGSTGQGPFSNAGPFGQTAAATTGGSLFGKPAAANTGSSLFSQGPSQSHGLFGQGTAGAFSRPIPGTGTSLFGNPGSSQYDRGLPGVAEAQASLFRAPPSGDLVGDTLRPTSGGLFSAASAPHQSGGSLFAGGTFKLLPSGDPLSGTLFGAPSTPASDGPFGATAAPQHEANPFSGGASKPSLFAAVSGNLFGGLSKPAPDNFFDPSQPASRWGPPAGTSETTASVGLFSSGAQTAKLSLFGANDGLSPGIFGSTAPAQPTDFGSTNQQDPACDDDDLYALLAKAVPGFESYLKQLPSPPPGGLFSNGAASTEFPNHPSLSTGNIFAHLANASAPDPSPANGFSNPASFSNLAPTLRQKTKGPPECQKCATPLSTHSCAELEDRLCDICTGKKETLCWACERKIQSATGEAGREVDTATYEARFTKVFRGTKIPETMREFLKNQPKLSKSECDGQGEVREKDKEDGKGKEKETNESEQTRKQESSDFTTAYDLQAAAAEDEDIKRMIAEFEAEELQWKNNEKAYAAKKAAAVAAEKAKVAQRVRDEDERLRQLEREADEAEEARILRREEERKICAKKTAAEKGVGRSRSLRSSFRQSHDWKRYLRDWT
jgi:hypothetical protein